MYILDRYIFKKFLSTFFLAIGLIICIVIIFDLSEKLDDFIYKKAPLHLIVFQYYVNFIPFFINMFSPLFTFISVIFFTSKMASNSEIIAILSSGISYRRMLVPYLYGGILIAIMTFFFSNFLIPLNNTYRADFEKNYFKKRHYYIHNNIHVQLDKNTHCYAQTFKEIEKRADNFTYEKLNDKNEVIFKISADHIVYDSILFKWNCRDINIREVDGLHEKLHYCRDTNLDLGLVPEDFNMYSEKPETKNFFQLNQFIEREKMRGSPLIKTYLIEKYQRVINPLTVLIMTFIGVAVSSKKIRGGTGIHLALGITIAFTYVLFSRVSTVFSIQGNMAPFLSVLLPSAIFGIIAFFLVKKASK